jgi:outer membrane immunogenic protein
MKRICTALTALVVGVSPALAGGYGVAPTEPVVHTQVHAAPAFNWTGGYAGLGIGMMRQSDTALNGPAFVLAPARGSQLSGLLGYNYQGAGAFVFGGELMVAGGSVDGAEPCDNASYECATDVGTTAALRLRMGVAQDRNLFFVTAGVARISVTHSTEQQPSPGLTSVTVNRNATTFGIGVEHAMLNGWNIRGDLEAYRLRSGTYPLDFGLDYSTSRGTASAARLTFVRRF